MTPLKNSAWENIRRRLATSRTWQALAVVLLLVIGGGAAIAARGAGASAPQAPAIPFVRVVQVEIEDVRERVEFIGRVEAVEAVEVEARVNAALVTAHFSEGAEVAAGALLFTLEDGPYRAAVAQGEARLARARALRAGEDERLERTRALAARDAISQAQLDAAIASQAAAVADVALAQADLSVARINLGYTRIRAPMAGRIGAARFSPGDVVGPGLGMLARIVQLDPVEVTFSISDTQLLAAKRATGIAEQERLNARFRPEIVLPDGQVLGEGRIEFTNNEVDVATGTVVVRGRFDNPGGQLLPGQFVTARVSGAEPVMRATVPTRAIMTTSEGTFVFTVRGDRAARRQVELGAEHSGRVAVVSGIQPGESVVVEGLQALRGDGPVRVADANS